LEEVLLDQQSIKLTTPEITGLWSTYIQNSAVECVLKYFLSYLKDSEIIPIVVETLELTQFQSKQIRSIFAQEQIPVPVGFSDTDVDLLAPPLYSDLFALSFVYRLGQVNLHHYGSTTSKVAHKDVVDYFTTGLKSVTILFKKSLNMMLTKGIYDRPPKIPYQDKALFVKEQSYLGEWFGKQRPLNTLELGEIFFVVERNYIGLNLLLGFIQVMEDKEIKQFLIKGKELCKKQISIFNDLLLKEDLFEISPVPMEFTDSTKSPFSDKLIMFLISMTTSASIPLLAYALSVSMRKDLVIHYSRIIAEVMLFGEDGARIIIKNHWLEEPPGAINRHI
jgi:hypothetical protein